MKRGEIDRCLDQAHAAGAGCARNARAALYGTRFELGSNASTAPDRQSIGTAPRSVYQGPRHIHNGAPALRRDRPA